MNTELMQKCREKLIEVARIRGTIPYGALAKFLGVANQSVGVYLNPIYEREVAEGRPDLTVVVIYPKTGMGRYNSGGKQAQSIVVDPKNLDDVQAYKEELALVHKQWSRC
jgi:hypothetical protein